MSDILSEIVAKRKADIAQYGYTFGCSIPAVRTRKIQSFLDKKGAILEIKRASPSKGDIAPWLDAAETARTYEHVGAAAISVLTEKNWFKGSLDDLKDAANSAGHTAILRKDFLIDEQEVDISYRCGADAVLLIARILDEQKLLAMVRRCALLGITAFIEVRIYSDIAKLQKAEQAFPQAVAAGVNSRDLTDFSIDMLMPARLLPVLPSRSVFESGIHTPKTAAFAASMGFRGILAGEAAARNPQQAAVLVQAFTSTETTANGTFWTKVSQRNTSAKPLVKLCGFTRVQDTVHAAELGADFTGFVFSAKSRRQADEQTVRDSAAQLLKRGLRSPAEGRGPFLTGVITDPSSSEAGTAFRLVQEEVLDCIQFHNCAYSTSSGVQLRPEMPCYSALKFTADTDITKLDALLAAGEPRILIDAKADGFERPSRITGDLIEKASERTRLWLAGGITLDNIKEILCTFHPELIDVAAGIEDVPGIKNSGKMEKLLAACSNTN